MNEGITVSMPGVRDLIAELKELKEDVARRTVRRSIKEAGDYILRRLRANAPIGETRRLRSNLSVITRWKSRAGVLQAKIRISTRGKASDPGNAFYWSFVERGHRDRAGHQVAPQEFVKKTNDEIQRPVARMFFAAIEKALDKRGKARR